jgi:iron complex outermembrane receptor protein
VTKLPASLPASRRLPVCLLLLAASAAAQEAQQAKEAKEATAAPPESVPAIVIFGQGQTRQVQNITRNDLDKALPGTSPLKTLEKLPGVSFQSADAFGAYEWSTRFSVRGFSQGQLGFTLDNVPLGNMSYGNNNGLHISRAISSENLGQVDLSQGAGAVGTASSGNLGGTVQFVSSDPRDEAGGSGAQTLGSHQMQRTYVRFDSGLLGPNAKFYLSATRQHAMKWKGDGPQDQLLLNSKVVRRFGDNKVSAFYNYSDRSENDYQDMSLDMQRRLGWSWDNYTPDWQRALNAARGIFTGGVTNLDDAYFNARGLRKDRLMGASADLAVSPELGWKSTVYHHGNDGQGHWYTPYQASPGVNGLPVSIRTTEYSISRSGVTSELSLELGKHTVNGGLWLEHNEHILTRNYYAVTGPQDTNRFLSDPFLTGFRQVFNTRTAQFFLQDTVLLLDDKLKLNAGFKSPHSTIDTTSMNAARAAGTLKAERNFLPQLGLNYDLNHDDEVFTSVSRNLRAFEAGVYGQFSQSQAAFDANGARLKPESSTTFDLGYRFKRASLTGSVALYRADFSDRLLSVATCAGVVGCPNTVVNVGKVATRGMEAAAVWTMAPHWSWFNTLTLNDSRYQSDYIDGTTVVTVSGKQVVDAPRHMLNSELSYDAKPWFARFGAKYTDKRYYTFLNDGAVPAYWVASLSGGMKFANVGAARDLALQVHVGNLFDRRYFSTIGSNQFVASDPHGQFATLLVGAPREVFITLSGKL